ncbi:hypothetical protein MRX96_024635 [Rhipicephalus microplus]
MQSSRSGSLEVEEDLWSQDEQALTTLRNKLREARIQGPPRDEALMPAPAPQPTAADAQAGAAEVPVVPAQADEQHSPRQSGRGRSGAQP